MLREANDDEADLNWYFVDCFPNKGRKEEGCELHLEVSAHEPGQIEEWVWDLNVIGMSH